MRSLNIMDHSPEVSALSFNKHGFASIAKEELAITYLIDSDAEEERLARWQELLPRIMDLKNGGKESERQLMNQVRKGVEDSLRHIIWPMLLQKPVLPFSDCRQKCELKDINLDLERTFPNHKESKSLEKSMKMVLNALAYSMPQVGYCQGMNFIVGTLLLKLDSQQAFNMAYHIFHWQRQEELLTNLNIIHEKLYSLSRLIHKHYPQLHKHLENYEVDPIVYASSWFITLFCNCIPPAYAFRILQCMLLDGQKVIYRVALQLLKMKKHTLKKLNSVEKIVEEIKNHEELIESNIDTFFDGMYKIKLSRFEINEYKSQFRQKQAPKHH